MKTKNGQNVGSVTYAFCDRILMASLSSSNQDVFETFIGPTWWVSRNHTLVAKSQRHYLDFSCSKVVLCSVNHFNSE